MEIILLSKEAKQYLKTQIAQSWPKNRPVQSSCSWTPDNFIDGRYIWLPINLKDGYFEIEWKDQWEL